jgi:hypothetical protein
VEQLEKAITAISLLSAESNVAFLTAWKHWSVPKDHLLPREHTVAEGSQAPVAELKNNCLVAH